VNKLTVIYAMAEAVTIILDKITEIVGELTQEEHAMLDRDSLSTARNSIQYVLNDLYVHLEKEQE
jgi:hypothetical protein